MKKGIRRVLLAVGVLIALTVLASLGFFMKFNAETRKMSPLDTKQVQPGIYAVNNSYVNMYLVKAEDGYIAVDAGANAAKAEKEMQKLGIGPEEVKAVFLTHTDMDHVAALELFKNAAVFISDEEKQMVDGTTHRQLIMNNSMKVPYKTLKDGEKLTVSGVVIHGILTPGHTPGSMTYLVNEKYLFTGDTMSIKSGEVQLFNAFFNMDSNRQAESLHRLAKLRGVDFIFTGHYGYTDNYEKAFRNW